MKDDAETDACTKKENSILKIKAQLLIDHMHYFSRTDSRTIIPWQMEYAITRILATKQELEKKVIFIDSGDVLPIRGSFLSNRPYA